MSRLVWLVFYVIVIVGLVGCGSESQEARNAGYEITAIEQKEDYTSVYLRIDTSKAELPVTILKDQTYLLKKSGPPIPAAGFALIDVVAVDLAGVIIRPYKDQNKLKFETIRSDTARSLPGAYSPVAPINRPPNGDELAIVFKANKEQITGVQITSKEGKQLKIPFAEK